MKPYLIGGLNLFCYFENNLPGRVEPIYHANAGKLDNFVINTIFSLFKSPSANSKTKNSNYWNPLWENSFLDTNWPGFFVVTTEGFELINWNLSIYKGKMYLDNNKNYLLYISGGNIGIYAGFNYKKGIGLDASANVLEIGFDGKIIDANIEGLSIGFTYTYKDGKLELKNGYGWWGWSISIDFLELAKWLFGGK